MLVIVHEQYIDSLPTNQNIVDLMKGCWNNAFPPALNVHAGSMQLFDDGRLHWLVREMGGLDGMNILELGPLEAGHTTMLLRAGAREVTAIEANSQAYIKCLIVKELLCLDRASFLLGDFVKYLECTENHYDLIVASGVLYHMLDPIYFLELLSETSNQVFLWTHIFDDDAMPESDRRRAPIIGRETYNWQGMKILLYRRTYFDASKTQTFCGGIHSNPAWLERNQFLEILERLGFTERKISFDEPRHPNGPALAILARR